MNNPLEDFDGLVTKAIRDYESRLLRQELAGSDAKDRVMTETERLISTIKVLGRKLMEDGALDMSTSAADAFALTLLMIHKEGTYAGGFLSPQLDKLARILVGKANDGKVEDSDRSR